MSTPVALLLSHICLKASEAIRQPVTPNTTSIKPISVLIPKSGSLVCIVDRPLITAISIITSVTNAPDISRVPRFSTKYFFISHIVLEGLKILSVFISIV